MASNLILPFATGNGATVPSDASWATSGVIAQGFQNGVADPSLVNKALRQGTAVASGFAQFVADYSAQDFTDSLPQSTMELNFRIALAAAQSGAYYAPDTSSTANSVVLTLNPPPVTLNSFIAIYFKIANTNTGAVQLNLNGFGNKALVRRDGSALQANDLVQGRLAHIAYDAALGSFRMLGAVASDTADISQQVATNKIPFNEKVIISGTRVSMSMPANNPGVFATGITGMTYTKMSATSRLVVQGAFACFSPIIIGQGAAAVTHRMRATSGSTILFDDTTVSTGALIGTNAPFHVGSSPVWAIDGLPAGALILDLLFKRDDNLAWQTVVHPTSADVPGFPTPNYGKFIVKEEQT